MEENITATGCSNCADKRAREETLKIAQEFNENK